MSPTALRRGGTTFGLPLNFYSELGGIHPDEVYLVGRSRKNGIGQHGPLCPLHTFLFWGQEAQDIAAALRKQPE